MPGITGIICKQAIGNQEDKLNTMLQCMLHESFYSYGTFCDHKNGFYIGYVSLAGSFSDCMPIYSEKKNLVMFLTGECYYDENVLTGLKNRGHQFNKNCAEFLVHLYEEEGDAIFLNLNGWYNGIIVDLKNGRAVLFNDRYGIRRIYYHENDESVIFSSEAKSILKAFPQLREISPQSVGEYLTYDCVLKNRTFFSNVFLIPPGSLWNVNHGTINKKRYFDPAVLENQSSLSEEKFFEKLSDTFQNILPRYFHGDSIGLSLTGGLDTRMILACRNPEPGDLPCYTFGSMYRDIFDVRLAPKVAKTCDQTHTVLRLEDNYLSEYPTHVNRSIYISDGLESVDKADMIFLNKLAREIASIRMTGIYGSQVLKSIAGLKPRPPFEQLINQDFKEYTSKAHDTFSDIEKNHSLSFMLFNEIAWWWNGFIASQSSQVTVRSPYLDYDFIKVLYQAPSLMLGVGSKFQIQCIGKCKPDLLSIPTTGTYGGSSLALIAFLRKYVMKFLIKADLVHVRERIPQSDFFTHFVGRIDHLLSPLHADKLIMGFLDYRRYRVWFRDQLSHYIRETLLCDRTFNRPYWDKKYLEKAVNDHIEGRGTFLREIRKVLQIELIHRILVEEIGN